MNLINYLLFDDKPPNECTGFPFFELWLQVIPDLKARMETINICDMLDDAVDWNSQDMIQKCKDYINRCNGQQITKIFQSGALLKTKQPAMNIYFCNVNYHFPMRKSGKQCANERK